MKPSPGNAPTAVVRSALPRVALLSVLLISTALISYEIVLMRRLLLERWHHFGYLVISAALLGFGASGTLLALLERVVRRQPRQLLWWSAAGLAAALIVLPRVAGLLPVTARFIPDDLWRQVGWWSLYWAAVAIPFLLGALHLGGALLTAGSRVGRVYAVSLFGSAIGALAGALLVARFPIEFGLWPSLVLALLATALLAAGHRVHFRATAAIVLIAGAVLLEIWQPLVPVYDEYKYAAFVQRLVRQGSARRIADAADPHGYVEIYESALFHDLPFLSLSERPPAMYNILINGDAAGSVFRIADVSQARAMDRTLMAFPYAITRSRPRVLLIGEVGGTNVWLARRQHAEHTIVIQPNTALMSLLRGPLAESVGHVLDQRDVTVINQDSRAFLTRTMVPFDLIQIVSLEGLGVGSAGMRGLAEDHLVTVEGLAACLHKLRPEGMLAVCRGIQTPQRENVRLLATLIEALESLGVEDPGQHVIQVRDYLGVCTLALKSPLDPERRASLRAAIEEFGLTPIWYEGLPPEELNQPDEMDGPPQQAGDWLHHAASELLSSRRAEFYQTWLTNVRPPRDDAPFFWDFYRGAALPVLRAAYGDLWLTRAELGRLFLYSSLFIAGVAAFVLILLPLSLVRLRARFEKADSGHTLGLTIATVVYFAAIGLGFMSVEMALISRAIRIWGDPVIASAAVIGGLLVLSGLGSLIGAAPETQRRLGRAGGWLAPAVVAGLAMLLVGLWQVPVGTPGLTGTVILFSLAAVILGICMGVPLPVAIAALDRRNAGLVPWAWGVNGVASVIGTSLALVLAMSYGYRGVVVLAAGLYALAAVAILPLGAAVAARGAKKRPLTG
ncbi:MAG: hypothetical protein ABIG44_06105 [Planctomycetota bacterium]